MHNPYPDLPLPRARAILLDVTVFVLLLLCWTAGTAVHGAVSELDVLGRGVERAGTQVRDGFESAGDKVNRTPVVGDDLEDALDDAGRETGVPVVRAGTKGREAVADLADVLGWTVGGLPALVLVLWFVPGRVRRARGVLHARRVFAEAADPERQRLLAMRAAFSLSFAELLPYTRDPIGDLAAARHEPLLRALGAAHGLRAPGTAR